MIASYHVTLASTGDAAVEMLSWDSRNASNLIESVTVVLLPSGRAVTSCSK